jgi:hypothetical protein
LTYVKSSNRGRVIVIHPNCIGQPSFVEILYFTFAALVLYAVSDWILQRLELARGERFEHRSLIFLALMLVLTLPSFALIRYVAGQ